MRSLVDMIDRELMDRKGRRHMTTQLPTTEQLLADPSISYWFKSALRSALTRDPVDALLDAELLVRVLSRAEGLS